MKLSAKTIRLSATDLSNHLACRHVTALDLRVARGEKQEPAWAAPHLAVIRELGQQHEAAYLDYLANQGLAVTNLAAINSETTLVEETLSLMSEGAEVIAQGALTDRKWFGRPDVLRRVAKPCPKWTWSYEVADTKLALETKAATILQISLYSELLGKAQGSEPETMWVIPPGNDFKGEPYRVAEYAAYFRYVKSRLERVTQDAKSTTTYPEPVPHCDVCRWFRECDAQRRAEDHLSLVAGIRLQQRNQLEAWDRKTVARLAEMSIPLKKKPLHGSRESMERVREQARVQVESRAQQKPVYEWLEVKPEMGFCRLPEPSPFDMFVDLEGDPFAGNPDAGGGQEYLFGFVSADDSGAPRYESRWALAPEEEKAGFEWLVDEVMQRWKKAPAMHIYHFAGYESGAFKRLMGRHATREEEVDGMLRAGLFVDLHAALKQAIRAGVEEYSLKKLEVLYGFERKTALDQSREAMRYIEHGLQLGWKAEPPEKYRVAMEGYNCDDCLSAKSLRDWLEVERAKAIAKGAAIARPVLGDPTPTENLKERIENVNRLIAELTSHLSPDRAQRKPIEQGQWLLAQLLDWHRRENNANCWEYYRLADLDDNALLDERSALSGLQFLKRTPQKGRGHLPVDTYSYPGQDTDVREKDKVGHKRAIVGTVENIDPRERTISIKKTGESLDLHPSSIFVDSRGPNWEVLADSTFRIGAWVKNHSLDETGEYQALRDLLLGVPPRLAAGGTLAAIGAETTTETACRVTGALQNSVFAIQGPPGSGKTFTAARMICSLVRQQKKVGVTALSHKVIAKVLKEVQIAAPEFGVEIRCIQKIRADDQDEQIPGVEVTKKNEVPLAKLTLGACQVAAGTAWMWARKEYAGSVDVLIVDEAGQMALADVIAAGQAARNLILVGDPQQLERPLKGSHPEGAEKSALQHLIGEQKTIAPNQGMLLPLTRRMHPNICRFTSELFYDSKLHAHPLTEPQRLQGHPWLEAPGLWFIPAIHTGCRNSSAEEVDIVEQLVKGLVESRVQWFLTKTTSRPMTLEDVLVVAPYNAQVSDLLTRLPKGAKVGTVDKFQGQEAPLVIYSLTTSSPEDAPRGMEFLYSLNRLNVATSRAMSNVILVGNPRLFEPECRTPRQIQLANALCRFSEMAHRPNRPI